MKLQLTIFKCAKCANIFKAPDIAHGAYGEFLLRSVDDELAYLDAIADETYQEVNLMVKANLRMIGKTPNVVADILRKTYGAIACDSDSSGQPYQIGRFPKCPGCNSNEMEFWEPTEPPEFIEEPVRPVTHTRWSLLSRLEREERVDHVLSCI